MTDNVLSRPEVSEYAPYYHRYIGPIADQDVMALLRTQANAFEPLRLLGDSDAAYRYGPDKWSVKEVIGHVTDAERVFSYRMLRIARGDQTPLAGFEQEPYVEAANFDRHSISTLIDAFQAVRAATMSLATELDDVAWRRMGTASEFPVSVRALAYIAVGHAAHHIEVLRDRYGISL
jgi:hypothetical protein